MPIYANNVQIVQKSDEEVAIIAAANLSSALANTTPVSTVLVVNGKAKKIGRQSQYLLDMLTIEE